MHNFGEKPERPYRGNRHRHGGNPYPAVFDNAAAAEEAARETTICKAWDYQIVELEI